LIAFIGISSELFSSEPRHARAVRQVPFVSRFSLVIRIGTSGWQYRHWRGPFYPRGLRQRDELHHLAERLPTVEVNGTVYSLTRPSACAAWRREVPDGFLFAIKGSRYITHMLKLRGFETALANFCAQGILRLGAALGPVLWQLPPQLPFGRERVARFLDALPRDVAAMRGPSGTRSRSDTTPGYRTRRWI
jgi:uncharacterized protein YecE (DUF72 family)